jgi:hypothetical protein
MLVFPGSSIVLPTPLLAKQLPYVYECSCSNFSSDLSDNADTHRPSSPLSDSSIANHHALPDNALPHHFNGTMFGQVFYLTQVAQPLVAHALSTAEPTHSPTKVDHSLPRRFNGTLFGQAFYLPSVAQALSDHDVATAYPLPLSCDPFTSTHTTPLQVPKIIPFAKPDSIDLTIQPPNNLLHSPPKLSEIPHVSAIPDPTNTQCKVATPSTMTQYSILSPYSCLPSSSQFPRFLMIPRFDFESTTTQLVTHRSVISKRPPPKPPHTKSAGFHYQIFTPHVYPLYQLFGRSHLAIEINVLTMVLAPSGSVGLHGAGLDAAV